MTVKTAGIEASANRVYLHINLNTWKYRLVNMHINQYCCTSLFIAVVLHCSVDPGQSHPKKYSENIRPH